MVIFNNMVILACFTLLLFIQSSVSSKKELTEEQLMALLQNKKAIENFPIAFHHDDTGYMQDLEKESQRIQMGNNIEKGEIAKMKIHVEDSRKQLSQGAADSGRKTIVEQALLKLQEEVIKQMQEKQLEEQQQLQQKIKNQEQAAEILAEGLQGQGEKKAWETELLEQQEKIVGLVEQETAGENAWLGGLNGAQQIEPEQLEEQVVEQKGPVVEQVEQIVLNEQSEVQQLQMEPEQQEQQVVEQKEPVVEQVEQMVLNEQSEVQQLQMEPEQQEQQVVEQKEPVVEQVEQIVLNEPNDVQQVQIEPEQQEQEYQAAEEGLWARGEYLKDQEQKAGAGPFWETHFKKMKEQQEQQHLATREKAQELYNSLREEAHSFSNNQQEKADQIHHAANTNLEGRMSLLHALLHALQDSEGPAAQNSDVVQRQGMNMHAADRQQLSSGAQKRIASWKYHKNLGSTQD